MRRKPKRRLMGEINVVPYIDVMLVLLIIFMVTAPLLTQGVEVELPKAAAEPIDSGKNDEPLVLSVDAAGRYYLSVGDREDAPIDAERVVSLASAVLRRKPETPVLVKADQKVAYGRVVEAMVLLQQAGATRVGFLTDPPDTSRKRRGQT
ncbi:MAG: biopolymer transport protein ExbD [Gammaproteobacteria bacterium]|nr:MAG: protein TolR [Pseudomonadota bacterium]MBC6944054.1 protein TolR [Gammaproteobacteria bacterium]MCE7895142.1 protein TolR [Gammaproteobacteria bacterium PRO8]MDL1880372.1 protein TolR [Gammaproteobacteria bacterium PRO2]MCL4776007.1 protein TolR [Gammaproteobacteria bacterium]